MVFVVVVFDVTQRNRAAALHRANDVSLAHRRVVGAEALMRWDCPEIGPVSPVEFISMAEKSGVIVKLGVWMLREACGELLRWHLAGFDDLRIAVNISALQVQQPDFVRLVTDVCEETGVAPSALELELTERMMMQRDGMGLPNLEALRLIGVRVSVDDFGTGYSSLSYLRNLPLDSLKIDRSFVAPIAEDPFQREIARSVVALAHQRDLKVVGEGVETAEQLEVLRAMGCDEIQGYLLGRPMPAAEFEAMLQRRARFGPSAPRRKRLSA